MKKSFLGEKPNPEHLDADKALNEIRARDMRRRREEEAEERERARKRKQEEEQATLVDEMMKSSARNIARLNGLPEDAFDGMRPEEVAVHARFLRLSGNMLTYRRKSGRSGGEQLAAARHGRKHGAR